jgi:hypothetical protein
VKIHIRKDALAAAFTWLSQCASESAGGVHIEPEEFVSELMSRYIASGDAAGFREICGRADKMHVQVLKEYREQARQHLLDDARYETPCPDGI